MLPSQQPGVISDDDLLMSEHVYLPSLITVWRAIEQATGFRWRCTSFIRLSPTHKRGQAIDLAPDFSTRDGPLYAANRGSDPVLYKREWLVNRLQSIKDLPLPFPSIKVGVFIEPDHLHVQVLKHDGLPNSVYTVKWAVPKPVYSDTYQRMTLPVFRSLQ